MKIVKTIARLIYFGQQAWDLLHTLERWSAAREKFPELDLSMGLAFISPTLYRADVTPQKGPMAREYGHVWFGEGSSPAEALHAALDMMEKRAV